MKEFPLSIRNFGKLFVEMQQARNRADYDPYGTSQSSLWKLTSTVLKRRDDGMMKSFEKTPEKRPQGFLRACFV